MHGNTNARGDAVAISGKCFRFCLTASRTLESVYLERGSSSWESLPRLGGSGVFAAALEKSREVFIFAFDRTHNRIRSPRLAASSR